jgi:hypothetical protein
MSVIPCKRNEELHAKILEYSEILKTQAHQLISNGLDEQEFYNSGIFRGAIEQIRGEFIANVREKREFVKAILNFMQDRHFIGEWNLSSSENRHEYAISMPSGRMAVVELKGCMDGNNTNIFERPPDADEFIIWSVCTNPGADPRRNAWSGIHSRLSADIISRSLRVDGLIIWDMACGTLGRPCPKLSGNDDPRIIAVNHYRLPPPCIYLLPATVPSPGTNPNPAAQQLVSVEILKAFADCFNAAESEINSVSFTVTQNGDSTVRATTVTRNGVVQRRSKMTAIRRA